MTILYAVLNYLGWGLSFLFLYSIFFFKRREGARFSRKRVLALCIVTSILAEFVPILVVVLAPEGSLLPEIASDLSILALVVLPFIVYPRQGAQNVFLLLCSLHFIMSYQSILDACVGLFDLGEEAMEHLVYFTVFGILLIPTQYITRRLFMVINQSNSRKLWALLCGIPLLFCGFSMAAMVFFYADAYPAAVFLLSRIETFFALLVILLLISVLVDYVRKQAATAERAAAGERLLRIQQGQYAYLQESIGRARRARHDLRQHLAALGGYLHRGEYTAMEEYLQAYQESPALQAPQAWCVNASANAILTYYAGRAENEGIALEIQADIPPVRQDGAQSEVDTDLCVVLGNLLENALDACKRMPVGARFVRLHAAMRGEMLHILLENSATEALQDEAGAFLSAKRGHTAPGLGLACVQELAEKHGGGAAVFGMQSGIFSSVVTLSLEDM